MSKNLSDKVKCHLKLLKEFNYFAWSAFNYIAINFPLAAFNITVKFKTSQRPPSPYVVWLVTSDEIAQVIDCQNTHGPICATLSSGSTFPSLYISSIGKPSFCVSLH